VLQPAERQKFQHSATHQQNTEIPTNVELPPHLPDKANAAWLAFST